MQKLFIRSIYFLCFSWVFFLANANEIQKITTPHFTIAFDKSCIASAQRIANTLETLYKPVSKTLGVYPAPLRLLMNNKSSYPNGYFTYLPRHINFYTLYHSDPHFIGNADWLNLLSIHEFRHAVQYSIEYESTPCWLRPIYFGANVISVCGTPSFFKEGDAVGIETACSKSGRGRLPGWEKIYKVNLLERDPISFARQVFGSSKHDMPNEYHFGYYFTTHIRRNYGVDAIKSIFQENILNLPYFGFYNAIKKVTKKSILQVYKDMNQELLLSWQKQLAGLKITPTTHLTAKKPSDNFDYIAPFIDKSGNLIAWKTGIGLRPQLVQVGTALVPESRTSKKKISCQKEKLILYFKNTLPSTAWAIGQGCAAWLEQCAYPWQKDRQTIRLQYYDFKEQKKRTLVSNSRYVALAISPNADQIVAVTSDEAGKHFLVVLETKSGKIVKKIDNPDQGYYVSPSWSSKDHIIVVKTKNQKNSIIRINIYTNEQEVLLPESYEHRSQPKVYEDYLLYDSSYNGIDNIYAMHLPTKACFQVTSRKYGAYLGIVEPKTNQLVFNDYTKNGMDIVVMPFDSILWTPLTQVEDRSIRYYEPLVVQEENSDVLTKVPNRLYPFTKYSYLKDSLAFIGPNIVPNSDDKGLKIEPFRLVNLQETLKATPYFYENFNISNIPRGNNYKTTEIGLKVKYRTIYPVLKANIKTARYKDSSIIICKVTNNYYALLRPTQRTYWRPELGIRVKFPYYFTLNNSSGKASVEASMDLTSHQKKTNYTHEYNFKIKNYSTVSQQDLHVPYSQQVTIAFRKYNKQANTYSDNLVDRGLGNLTKFISIFYFPGVGHHHYFFFQTEIHRKKHTNINGLPHWNKYIKLVYGGPLLYPELGIPLIWFLEKVWIEAYYKYNHYCSIPYYEPYVPSTTPHYERLDAIGTTLHCTSRFLCNKTLPHLQFAIDFDLFKKKHNEWLCDFSPAFRFAFDVFGAGKNK